MSTDCHKLLQMPNNLANPKCIPLFPNDTNKSPLVMVTTLDLQDMYYITSPEVLHFMLT